MGEAGWFRLLIQKLDFLCINVRACCLCMQWTATWWLLLSTGPHTVLISKTV